MKDRSPKVRRAAARALVFIGDKRAVEPLIQAFEDEDSGVRYAAVTGFRRIKDERAVKPLIKALKDENREVRLSAKEILREMGWKPSNKS